MTELDVLSKLEELAELIEINKWHHLYDQANCFSSKIKIIEEEYKNLQDRNEERIENANDTIRTQDSTIVMLNEQIKTFKDQLQDYRIKLLSVRFTVKDIT